MCGTLTDAPINCSPSATRHDDREVLCKAQPYSYLMMRDKTNTVYDHLQCNVNTLKSCDTVINVDIMVK